MEIEYLLRANSKEELREWLEEHSSSAICCWLLISTKERPEGIPYLDAVEEALCFGWIDGTAKKTENNELAQRFSPRRKKSNWTELNKERVRRLEKLGLMTEQGLNILPDMRPESFTIDPEIEARLKEDPQVYENFMNFPELYRRIRIDNIQGYKGNDRYIFDKRLDKLIQYTRNNKMYGQWDDNGRLSDY
ncbi:YdeI/OmpD-associated family protein [Planococcus sp. CP5-4]|uniref:YdeI/OmpD-associated family protein n=1 Tax=unclassified Planococcus (in: firmicutes) TaxID=2662419 RepID=UPI001C24B2AF|nr:MULTISPECIES: YdeI/OmpD-associated family protein [unclassified Planococcus (in: firmicutes)]MBU9674241.1 YdeI/OmpD-associated family protein [Planococcus sp. CP5-4_YE]MBV0909287.1 YdeI/OmpD-associated family protein [Planococcus sp. CP5-4_UN]MBW6063779.1 YdeI/OmpD-associated family protein [Planococcus sp. CP5-4]